MNKLKAEELYNQGNVNARNGMFEVAISLYEQAIAIDGSNPMHYNNRAACLKRLNRFKDAIKQYQDIIEKFPEYGKAFLSIGSTSIELEEYHHAVSAYSLFLSAHRRGQFTFNPIAGGVDQSIQGDNLLQTALLTSINYLSLQQQQLAIQAFKEAEINESKTGGICKYFIQAKTDFENGNLVLAEKNLSKSIELNPNYSEAYYSRGYIRTDLENHFGAIDDFSYAIQINLTYVDAYLGRANTSIILKRFKEAFQDAKVAKQLAISQNNTVSAHKAESMLSYIYTVSGCI